MQGNFSRATAPGGSWERNLSAVGDSGIKTAIPERARAKIDIRLAGGQDPDELLGLLEAFVREQGFPHVGVQRILSVPASRTPVDHPLTEVVARALEAGFERPPLVVPSLAATTPNYVFTDLLGLPTFIAPYAPHDQRNHAANESIGLGDLAAGVRTTAHLLAELGRSSARSTTTNRGSANDAD